MLDLEDSRETMDDVHIQLSWTGSKCLQEIIELGTNNMNYNRKRNLNRIAP